MIVNCLLLEQKIEELRALVQAELSTSPYVIDYLIAVLLDGMIKDYQRNYAQEIEHWRKIVQLIKEQIAEGKIEDEIKGTNGNS